MKHPTPWTINPHTLQMSDADGIGIGMCMDVTTDPEARAILAHAAEMWEALHATAELDQQCAIEYHYLHDQQRPGGDPLSDVQGLAIKINAEIAAAKRAKP